MLPGGLCEDGVRHREFAFKPVSGHVELAMADDTAAGASVPERVSRVLARTLASIGALPASAERIRRLSVADRQFLMRGLAVHLGHDAIWLSSSCSGCKERFDLFIEQSRLPVAEAPSSYPLVEISGEAGWCRLRVPTGLDQEAVAQTGDDEEAAWMLIERCFIEGEGEWSVPERIGRWRAAVDEALDRDAPQVALSAETDCPNCGAAQTVPLDPYLILRDGAAEVFDDVHLLASRYHWGEEEILSLSRKRRKLYVGRLDRDRGLSA